MVADIARVTYDPTRQYRLLLGQQGRVTLEADVNEAAMLASEALRLETIDIIGPTGTPDDGYKVGTAKGPGGIAIGTGTFYLGGWRLERDKPLILDGLSNDDGAQGNLIVALLLTEQSVCAVEDQALREVALGGPDTAARTRLMQHFPRLPLDGDSCAAGAGLIAKLLGEEGVTIDPATLQLMSSATLQAGFVQGPANTDPCQPSAAGGYLGADNQMVRVTVTEYDAAASTGRLLWGWNNASLLYRASMTDPHTLTLTNTPVDQEHAPQLGQMVEILRTELDLGDGNYIAAEQGFVTGLAEGYSFDSQEIVLNRALPADYQNTKTPLFVRLWQASVKFNAGQVTALDNVSGITVTIAMTALPAHIAARPFWRFSVRPNTPQAIYPQRYQDKPQPPDGPRQWITDLAVVEALEDGSKLLADCRVPFLPLTQQSGGCCGLVLGPDDVAGRGGLQAVVDSLAGGPAVLSLRPGTYALSAPLVLGEQNSGLTIEGCTEGVIIKAAGTDLRAFRLGLIRLNDVRAITFRNLWFVAPVASEGDKPAEKEDAASTVCCLLVGDVEMLTVEDCEFALDTKSAAAFGGAILVVGATSQVSLRRNRFIGSGRGREVFGVLAWVSATNGATELDQWEIRTNRFQNLAYAAVAIAQLGLVNCSDNVVVGCATGFVFAEANLGATNAFARQARMESVNAQDPTLQQAANAAYRPDLLAAITQKGAPILAALPTPPTAPAMSDAARRALNEQLKSSGASVYTKLAGATQPTTEAKAADVNTTDFDTLDTVALAAEMDERTLTPALRIEDNEVTLTAAVTTPWAGLAALLSPDVPGSVIVSGNRVVVPDATAVACGLMFPAGAVVTGNLFVQLKLPPDGSKKGEPCLIVLTASPAIMVSANVTVFTEYVTPARASQAETTTWEFLNTVG